MCFDWSAEVRNRRCVCTTVCVCVWWVQWGQPSLRSEEACRNVPCLWRACCLCSTNIRSRMKGMWLQKAPSSPVLLRDPIRFFILLLLLLWWWWGKRVEEGTYILMRWAGLEAAAQRDILLQSKHTNRADWAQDGGITMKLRFVGGMLFFYFIFVPLEISWSFLKKHIYTSYVKESDGDICEENFLFLLKVLVPICLHLQNLL